MAINLNIQADVIDIRQDTPKKSDIFFVDTNIWFWQTYAYKRFSNYQTKHYPNYLNLAYSNRATLTYSGLTLAELAHIIEKHEYETYVKSNGNLPIKEYRHNYPIERANVVAEVRSAWRQVKNFAKLIDLTVNSATTDAAINRFRTQAVDGYDLLLLETMSKAGQFQVITDDIDYSVVPDIQVFTSNNRLIQEAATQNKLVVR
jgi:hypothetical protein